MSSDPGTVSTAAADAGAEIGNPLGFLTDYAVDGGHADEILICTFNQNLAFFERSALGPCRATGAAVTILGDVAEADHDIVAVRGAGVSYVAANVRARRTFHPKLIVIAGRERSIVAVGSGNLTIAGWWGNDEVWSLHHGNTEQASPVIAQVAEWCRMLPEYVTVPGIARVALERVAETLDRAPTPSHHTDVRLLHTLDQPIVEQLPRGPVDELNLYAPFHDLDGTALTALLTRLQPAHTTIGFQPGLTSANGAVLAEIAADFVELTSDPYRHGKLIEWCSDGQWWAVTGSPNLSAAALCRAASSGGNVELATLAPIPEPLMPPGAPAATEQIAAIHRTGPVGRRRIKPVLLAACRTVDGVQVDFARPATDDAVLRYATPDVLPGVWLAELPVPPGTTTWTLDDLPGMTRVQVVEAGEPSNTVFVIDPVQACNRRRPSGQGPTRVAPTLEDVFADATAARHLLDLFAEAPKLARAPGAATDEQAGRDPESYFAGDWRDYLDLATEFVSASILNWALGLPAGLSASGVIGVPDDWDDDDPDDVEGGLDDEDVEDPDAGLDPVPVSERALVIAASEQERQRWWSTIQRQAPDGPVEQLFLLRAVLTFVAAGGLGYRDRRWVPVAHRLVRELAAHDPPEELLAPVGSLTALTLSITRSTLSQIVDDTDAVHQRRIEHEASHLVLEADATLISEYATGLETRFGSTVVDADEVLGIVAKIVNDDPFSDGLTAIEGLGHACTVAGTHLEIASPQSYPLATALTVISRMERVPLVSVRCRGDQLDSDVLLCWEQPDLLIVRPAANSKYWGAVYRLKGAGLATVRSGTTEEISHREVESFMPGRPPGVIAQRVLDSCNQVLES